MHGLRAIALLTAAGLAGCAEELPPPQLEALEVQLVSTSAEVEGGFAVTGALTVQGEGRDYRLVVEGDGEVELILHLPGESDLSSLDGQTVTLELTAPVPGTGARGVAIYDGGGLAFLAQNSWDGRLGAAWFGEDLVGWGEALHDERSEGRTVTYTEAVFDTSEGPVGLLPGEVAALSLAGATWRAVVNASYLVDDEGLFDAACEGPGDLISFELTRAEAAGAVATGLLEAESRRVLASECQ